MRRRRGRPRGSRNRPKTLFNPETPKLSCGTSPLVPVTFYVRPGATMETLPHFSLIDVRNGRIAIANRIEAILDSQDDLFPEEVASLRLKRFAKELREFEFEYHGECSD